MKITLVYSGIALIGFNSLGKGDHDNISINLGLAYIGAYLKQNSKHEVDLIDLRELKSWDHFREKVKQKNPDLIGMHFNTINYDIALQASKICKELGKIVVAGGPHATLEPEKIISSGWVDYVIKGEGEISFLKLADNIERKIKTDQIIAGEKILDLDKIPFPDRDLYNMNKILNSPGIFPYPNRYLGILTSRGCYYNCSFCQPLERNIFGNRVRTRSVDNVISEVEFIINKYKVNFIMFEDDTFTARKDWVIEFCGKIGKFGIGWGAQSRVDTLDKELAEKMARAGCIVLFFGFESGSPRILKMLRKSTTPLQAVNAGKLCKKYGILIFANYMMGVPTETREDLEATSNLIKEIRPELHSPTYFSPIPGSDLYTYCESKNLIKAASYSEFSRNPVNEKIKGIDYRLLDQYRERIAKYAPRFYEEKYYASIVIKRWLILLKSGYINQLFIEILKEIFIFRWLGRKIKNWLKVKHG